MKKKTIGKIGIIIKVLIIVGLFVGFVLLISLTPSYLTGDLTSSYNAKDFCYENNGSRFYMNLFDNKICIICQGNICERFEVREIDSELKFLKIVK